MEVMLVSDNKVLFAEERKKSILELLNQNDKVYVQEISRIFDVSPATIRNDLNELEKMGKLKRTHGGAISISNLGQELKSEEKKIRNINKKNRIAQKALELIQDEEIILLDTGTTVLELAKGLKAKRKVTIITNDIEIAKELEETSGINIILIGGMLRKGFHCTVGPFANKVLSEISVDKAFIAANGLDVDSGVYTPDTNQAEIKRMMISCARKSYLLCDSSKFGRKSFAKFANANEFDRIITDEFVDELEVKQLDNLEIV